MFRINCRAATGAGRGNCLLVVVIHQVTAREYTIQVGVGVWVVDLDITSFFQIDLALH